MKTSEKVLLGLMGVAVLYGAYEFLPFKKKDSVVVESQAPSAQEALTGMASIDPKSAKIYRTILEAALEKWPHDPFQEPPRMTTLQGDATPIREPVEVSDLAYMGYLLKDARPMAVISGVEYEVGDVLENRGDLVIVEIQEKQVRLLDAYGQEVFIQHVGKEMDFW